MKWHSEEEVRRRISRAAVDGAQVLTLEGGEDVSKQGPFAAVAGSLPCDPPLRFPTPVAEPSRYKWQAMLDSLRSGLSNLRRTEVVIIWPRAGEYRRDAPEVFADFVGIIDEVAETLADPEETGLPAVTIRIIGISAEGSAE